MFINSLTKKIKNLTKLTQRSITRSYLFKTPKNNFTIKVDSENSDPDFNPQSTKMPNSDSEEIKITEMEFTEENLQNLQEELKNIVKNNKIVLFMKGSPDMPLCGYSRFIAEVLKFYDVQEYSFVNVLSNEELRPAIKSFSDWPTFPQLYVDGEFIGGSDIVMDHHQDGSIKDILGLEG